MLDNFVKYGVTLLTAVLLIRCGNEPNFVNDNAKLLNSEQAEQVATFHRYLLADYDIDYRVETIAEIVEIDHYANKQFEALQVGSLSKGGRGLLLMLDTNSNRVRLEVSRALEAAYPDAFVAYIEHRQMTPFFASGRVTDGILAATELIVNRAQRFKENQGWDDEAGSEAATSGGGATAPAKFDDLIIQIKLGDKGSDKLYDEGNQPPAPDAPEVTLQIYLEAMSNRNANPDLAIYSKESRAMLNQWLITPAQMDNIVRSYRGCHREAVRYDAAQTLAVIRYPVGERACAPWFFVHDGDGWRLDLTGAQRYLRFGRNNSWHFDRRELDRHPYRFAFADWGFDNRGFPQKMR